MKILKLVLAVTVLSVAGCAADHNDTVLPGYYDGHHIPPIPDYPMESFHAPASVGHLHVDDAND